MPKVTDLTEIYDRIQTEYDFKVEDMSQDRLSEFLKEGRSDKVETPSITELAVKLSALADRELTPTVAAAETYEDYEKIEPIEVDLTVPKVKDKKNALIKKYRQIIDTTGNLEDYKFAIEQLRKFSPQSYGQLKTTELLRGRRLLKTI